MNCSAFFVRRTSPQCPLLLTLLLLACLGLPVRADDGLAPGLSDIPVFDPRLDYPDEQLMAQVSGTLTAIFRAQGSFAFPRGDSSGTVQRESLDLTVTVRNSLAPNAKKAVITRDIHGTKISSMENSYSRGVTVESYSGSDNLTHSRTKIYWSKARKLACFEFPGDVAYDFKPGNIHVEEDDRQWGDKLTSHHDHKTHDSRSASCLFDFPSHSTVAHSRFAQYLKGRPGAQGLGSWIEGYSANGKTSGSYTLPMFFDETVWRPEGTYRANGKDPRKPPGGPAGILWPGSIQVVWAFGDALPEGKMTIAVEDPAAYKKWVPSPVDDERFGQGSNLTFRAVILPKEERKPAPKGKIDFWLYDVSCEKGKCANFPLKGESGKDLRFSPNQAGLTIDPQNPMHATTKDAVAAFSVTVEALDTGAYGTLQATCEELGLIAEDERTHLQVIAIPMDDNRNRVADAWEDGKGILGENLTADWDEEQVAGQKTMGDSLALYENYRGFMVLKDDKPSFKRLDPKQKVLFVIDDGNIFDVDLWLHATDIAAYRLNDEMVKGGTPDDIASRIVDFNSGDGGHKYCVRLIKFPGLVESVQYEDQPPGNPNVFGYTDNQGISPKKTHRCVVFPARLRAMIDRVSVYVDNGLKYPSSADGLALAEAKIPPWLARNALERLGPSTRDQLAKQMVMLTAIHEMGHVCNLTDHLDKNKKPSDKGDPKCPMKYTSQSDKRHLLILQVIFALDHPLPLQYDRFCSEEYKCFTALNVKEGD